ncbi:hypothetical protein V6N12_021050 [Hibiscus sabdariffa]|uniref:Reverse transcriptase zinc-binding domain-containing protein n=1 Tax=Hibiscus sabdariffa TaxID=183260 RepID=A0ABR2B4Z7_9ROSI
MQSHSRSCVWREAAVEDSKHLFVSCNFIGCFWRQFCSWWHTSWTSPIGVDSFFTFCYDSRRSGQLAKIGMVVVMDIVLKAGW